MLNLISIFLLGHLHFFSHFFFTVMENLFKKHPIHAALNYLAIAHSRRVASIANLFRKAWEGLQAFHQCVRWFFKFKCLSNWVYWSYFHKEKLDLLLARSVTHSGAHGNSDHVSELNASVSCGFNPLCDQFLPRPSLPLHLPKSQPWRD